MRVIAGRLGGRQFSSPHSHRTHPMSDKARGALFNMLGELSGLAVLDAFAGSGALGFEAVSRGAASVVAIERDKAAQQAIMQNIRDLGLADQVKLVTASANAWLQTTPGALFDIVLCDPPYDDLQLALLTLLTTRVQAEGLFVLSWPGGTPAPSFAGLQQIEQRGYGDLQLLFYRRFK